MKKYPDSMLVLWNFGFLVLLMMISAGKVFSQTVLPKPDHIVVVFLENHAYTQIIGSESAPFINSLANDPNSALFEKSFGTGHPSQPNYLCFFSGSDQGVTDNEIPAANPFTTPNLSRQLIDSGYSFVTYSEDLPFTGFNEAGYENYVRKHNPVTNWMGTGINQVPQTVNQAFTGFPLTDFDSLPVVSFVVPNQKHNMHDGSDPGRIVTGDTWISENLNNYIEYTKTHNSLFILTFDEDNYGDSNRIVTIFTGLMVKAGVYSDSVNHYSILRTIEDMYRLPYAGNAMNAEPISNCWKGSEGISDNNLNKRGLVIYPNPARNAFFIRADWLKPGDKAMLEIYNGSGGKVSEEMITGSTESIIRLKSPASGIYITKLTFNDQTFTGKIILQKQ